MNDILTPYIIRPVNYYDNPGTKLLVTFAELNRLVGLTVNAATLNAIGAIPSNNITIDCGYFSSASTYVKIDCGAF